ncbi:MAG: prolipoprotein diacylglyceryl transferase [Desulfarculus sp.]|nr:MAG: prolipoprotein diacylglyceryl transferase [Desulfarculus sp.]
MYPILFHLGPLTIHTYGVMLALGVALGAWALAVLARRAGLNQDRVLSLALWTLLAGLAGARLAYLVLEPGPLGPQLKQFFMIWQGGLVFYGGLALAVPVGLWLARRYGLPLLTLLDISAPAMALGQAFGRLGCFFSGDSYGRPWDGPWAVVFSDPHAIAPQGVPLHPTQLYITGALLLIFAFLWWLWPRRRFGGQLILLYGLLHGVARLIIEPLRGDWRGEPLWGWLTPTGLFAALMAAACLAVYLALRRRGGQPPAAGPGRAARRRGATSRSA